MRVGPRALRCASGHTHARPAPGAAGNEKEIGEAITASIAAGVVKREDLFITSKVWNAHHAPADAKAALDATLANLNTPYVDLYLVHCEGGRGLLVSPRARGSRRHGAAGDATRCRRAACAP